MERNELHRTVLFASCAVRLGLATPAQVAAATLRAQAGAHLSLADQLEQDSIITQQQRREIERRVEEELHDEDRTLPAGEITRPDLPGVAQPAQCGSTPTERGDSGQWVAPGDPDRYTVLGVHARGGQGQILLAVDEQIGREIAIKEFCPDEEPDGAAGSDPASSAALTRFLREARVTGQLEHPNIVPVHEMGRNRHGVPYYSMRLVRGETLSRKLKKCRSLSERLKLLGVFWDLCKAIAFAHGHGVVHRDIKPRNVMVGAFDETVVLDWGLAKVEGKRDLRARDLERPVKPVEPESLHQTSTGTAMGTPAYMSPEQARGEVDKVDARSDVWGLGAVLYQILTGKPPFRGANTEETLKQVVYLSLTPVRAECPGAPPELAAVAEKSLAKKPSRRYRSAAELADEIGAFMTGGRVRAYTYSSWELLKRFASQNKPTIVAAAVVLAVILGSLVAVSLALRAETRARSDEHQARQREQTERRLANYHLAQAYLEKADRMVEDLRHPTAALLASASLLHNPAHPRSPFHRAGFAEAHPGSHEKRLRAASTVYRLALSPSAELVEDRRAGAGLTAVAFSPDGSRMAAACLDHTVLLWQQQQSSPRVLAGHEDEVYDVAFSPDGTWLASASEDGSIRLWNAESGSPVRILQGHHGMVRGLAFFPGGDRLASVGWDDTLRIWQLERGEILLSIPAGQGKLYAVDVAPDGKLLATAGTDTTVRLWSSGNGSPRGVLRGHTEEVRDVAFSPRGDILASASIGERASVRLWNVSGTGGAGAALTGHGEGAMGLSFSPRGNWLASAGYDGTTRLWETATGNQVLTIEGHDDFIYGVAFAPDGRHLATAGYDRRVRTWRIDLRGSIATLRGHSDWIKALAWSPDGSLVASGSRDNTVRVWDVGTRKARYVLRGHGKRVEQLAISPDSRWLASASEDRTVRVWNLRTGQSRFVLRGHLGTPKTVAFSPDGSVLATAGDDRAVRLWDTRSGIEILILRGHASSVQTVAFSPDGRLLASVGFDRVVRVWSIPDGKPVKVLKTSATWLSGTAFSPDGRLLAASGNDGQTTLWNTNDWEIHRRLIGHAQWVESVRFSPDSRLVATASHDTTVRIWSVETGATLLIIETGHIATGIDFAPQGNLLAVGDNRLVRLYPLDFSYLQADPAELLARASRRAGMELQGFELKVTNP